MSEIKTFEDLNCWIKGREIRRFVSKLVKNFPEHENLSYHLKCEELQDLSLIILLKGMVVFIIKKMPNIAECQEDLYMNY